MSETYKKLLEALREIGDLQAAEAVLSWDQQTYMPTRGNEVRSRQISLLSALAHKRLSSEALGDLLGEAASDESLDEIQQAQVREATRDRDKAVKVPNDLVRAIAETSARAHTIWASAREQQNFSLFSPILKKLIDLKVQEADALGYGNGVPYDALLDQFEPGMTVAKLTPIVEKTRDIVVAATKAIGESANTPNVDLLKANYDKSGQERFGLVVLKKLGYDFEAGRQDEAVHPFTTSFSPNDVRITTRYQPEWLPAALFGSIHECGHALYEQGLPIEHANTPLGGSISLGYHESQSRFWENIVGRSRAFWEHFYPTLKAVFPDQLSNVSLDEFYLAINTVQPSFVRVESDEVTYNLHIVVRYEIEQAIFSGQVKVEDLPELWNDKMEAYLGIRPANDAEGVLQDIHWSMGGFGYFPTYLLGNLYAAQWLSAIRADMPDLDERIARGDFVRIKNWMREKIHQHGRRYGADELARSISGEELNADHFAAYLKERFEPLYKVSW